MIYQNECETIDQQHEAQMKQELLLLECVIRAQVCDT